MNSPMSLTMSSDNHDTIYIQGLDNKCGHSSYQIPAVARLRLQSRQRFHCLRSVLLQVTSRNLGVQSFQPRGCTSILMAPINHASLGMLENDCGQPSYAIFWPRGFSLGPICDCSLNDIEILEHDRAQPSYAIYNAAAKPARHHHHLHCQHPSGGILKWASQLPNVVLERLCAMILKL